MSKTLRIMHLFAGIGAPEKALNNIGIVYDNVAYCEIDKYASMAYQAIHGENTKNLGDVTKIDFNTITDVDLLIGGFPCQTFSMSGKRAGFDDVRGTMCFYMANAIKTIKPKYFLFENVKGLLSHDNGNTIRTILTVFGDLGYEIAMDVLNAKDYGVPQNRERIFGIGRRLDEEYVKPNKSLNLQNKKCTEILKQMESDGLVKIWYDYQFPNKTPLHVRLKDILEPSVEPKYYLSQQVQDRFQFKPKGTDIVGTTAPDFRTIGQRDIVFGTEGTMGTLVATDYKQPKQIIEYENDEPMICAIAEPQERMTKQAFETLNENDCKDGDVINPFNKRVVSDGTCPTITTRPEGFKTANLIVEEPKQNRLFNIYGEDKGEGYAGNVWDTDGISPTLTTMQGGNRQPMVYDEPRQEKSYKIRKLTPRECYRLMGFSDEDFDKVKANGISDCQCYKQAGNSIVVNCLMAIFANMFKDTEYMDIKEYEKKLVEELDKAIENIELKQYDITQEVRVRANEVDIEGLQTLLRDSKKSSGLSNEDIATKLNKPLTHVAHWFRTDNCFSIPTEDVWYQLKEVLNITTDAFDKQVTEFVTKDGVFETANRAYDSEGLSPTITATLAPNVIEEQLDLVDWIHEQEEKESTMTIDEAIEHATEVSEDLGNCECGKEHQQLAEWLTELKERKSDEKKSSLTNDSNNDIDMIHFEEQMLKKMDKIIELLDQLIERDK